MRSNLLMLPLLSTLLFSAPVLAQNGDDERPSVPNDVIVVQQTIGSYFSKFPEVAKAVNTVQTAVAKGQCTTTDAAEDERVVDITIFCTLSPQREVIIAARQDGTPKGKPSAAERNKTRGVMMAYSVSFPHAGTDDEPVVAFQLYDGPPDDS